MLGTTAGGCRLGVLQTLPRGVVVVDGVGEVVFVLYGGMMDDNKSRDNVVVVSYYYLVAARVSLDGLVCIV